MAGTTPVTALLTKPDRCSIQAQAHGGRLRYRPRFAVTPELVERQKGHKAELRASGAAQPAQDGQTRSVARQGSRARVESTPELAAGNESPAVPRVISCRAGRIRPGQPGVDTQGAGRSPGAARGAVTNMGREQQGNACIALTNAP